jgi:mRNA interferase HicA
VKRKDLEKMLKELGWSFLREGGSHAIWAKGDDRIPIPRHKEVNENTARGIIREAKGTK